MSTERDWIKVYVIKSWGTDFVEWFIGKFGEDSINKMVDGTMEENYDIISCKVNDREFEMVEKYEKYCKVDRQESK